MYSTSAQAVRQISSGSNLFIQTAAAAPQQLIKALAARAGELKNVSIYQMHTEGEAPYAASGMEDASSDQLLQITLYSCIPKDTHIYIQHYPTF